MKTKFRNIHVSGPDLETITKVRKALNLVFSRHKQAVLYLKKLKAIIVLRGKYDNLLFGGLKVYICETGTVKESTTSYLASLFVHEARHIFQYSKKNKYRTSTQKEKDAYLFQRKFLIKLNKEGEALGLDEQYKSKWWVFKDKNGKKTEISPKNDKFRKIAEDFINDQNRGKNQDRKTGKRDK